MYLFHPLSYGIVESFGSVQIETNQYDVCVEVGERSSGGVMATVGVPGLGWCYQMSSFITLSLRRA